MRNLILSAFVLCICAYASQAFAQNPCERVLFHAPPKDCPPGSYESYDQFRERQRVRADTYRMQEDRRIAYERERRRWIQGPSADVRCGYHPWAHYCTIGDVELGFNWRNSYWGYGSFSLFGPRYGYDPHFAGDTYWIIPYKLYGKECPTEGPPDTEAPHNYEWRCEHGVTANYAAYVKKGRKQVLRDYAQRGLITRHAIIVKPTSGS